MLEDKQIQQLARSKPDPVDPFTSEHWFTGADGKQYKIYPMRLKDKDKMTRLFAKFDDTDIILNMPHPKINLETKEVELDEEGNEIIEHERYEAMMEILEMATKLKRAKLEDVADLHNVPKILDEYRSISQLKKRMASYENQLQSLLTGLNSM